MSGGEKGSTSSCKALESTLKTIFKKKNWDFDENAPLKRLMETAFSHELLPRFLEAEFTGLRVILESGVGTVRNKAGGHGAGEKKRLVPKEIAAFQLHQTAAAIKLCVDSAKLT